MKRAATLLILITLSFCFTPTAHAQSGTVAAMRLDELDGSTTTMSEYLRTGPVYLSFWALWCEPCKQELRALKGIAKSLDGRPVTIIAVNQDSPKSVHEVKAYIRSRGIAFPVVLDPNKQVFQAFNGQNLPFSVLIDAKGKVVKTRTGYLPGDEKEIEQDILRLLR